MKVAIIHDWLNQWGGAEQVLDALHELYPGAPVYTSIYDPSAMPPAWKSWDVRPSWMDRLPAIHRRHQPYLPLYALAFGRMDLSGYDLVISNKSGFCHGVRTGPGTLHICYCLTPTRYLWDYQAYVRQEAISPLVRILLLPLIASLRGWDRRAADEVDVYVAISEAVRARIARFYERDASVIHPPVDVDRFHLEESKEDYYLIVSRLVPYKRLDLAIEAFRSLARPLVVIGDGRARTRLEATAPDNVSFLGHLSNGQVSRHMARAKALILPGEEDFGVVPLEAQAAGTPVIAYAGGGALETVVEGVTGTLFAPQAAEHLHEAVERFERIRFEPRAIRKHALGFAKQAFQERFASFVEAQWAEHQSGSRGN
ncbi:MAG: glycosyltransferase [Anaerolineae bacterium]